MKKIIVILLSFTLLAGVNFSFATTTSVATQKKVEKTQIKKDNFFTKIVKKTKAYKELKKLVEPFAAQYDQLTLAIIFMVLGILFLALGKMLGDIVYIAGVLFFVIGVVFLLFYLL